MPLSPEEITQLGEAVKADELPEFLKPVAAAGYLIRNPTQESTFKESYKNSVIGDRDKELYGRFDTIVEEATGIKKNAGEQNSDYAKRAYGSVSTELTDLREQKKNGSLTQADKTRLTQLEEALKGKDEDVKNLTKKHSEDLLNLRLSGLQDSAISSIEARLKPEFKGDVFADIRAARIARFNASAKPVEDKDAAGNLVIIYKDEKGDVIMNPTTYKPATTAELMEKAFAPYIGSTPNQNGGGSGPQSGGNQPPTDKVTKDTYAPPAELKSRSELTTDLKAKGFAVGGADFMALMEKFGKKTDGTPLPLQ